MYIYKTYCMYIGHIRWWEDLNLCRQLAAWSCSFCTSPYITFHSLQLMHRPFCFFWHLTFLFNGRCDSFWQLLCLPFILGPLLLFQHWLRLKYKYLDYAKSTFSQRGLKWGVKLSWKVENRTGVGGGEKERNGWHFEDVYNFCESLSWECNCLQIDVKKNVFI